VDDDRAQRYRARGWWTGERLQDRFRRHVEADPHAPAIVDRDGQLTRGELLAAARALSATLAADLEPRRGQLILLPNGTTWQVAFLAVLLADGVPATIPTASDPANLAHALRRTGAATVITDPERRALAEQAIAAAGQRVDLIVLDGGAVERVEGSGARAPLLDVPGLDHCMFTSSTTGLPKAVMHSADTLATLNRQFSERFALDASAPIFMPSPLGHSVGAIHGARLSLWNGSLLVLQERWDPATAFALVDRYRCAFTAAATPFLVDLVRAPAPPSGVKLGSLRSFLCGGAQVPPDLLREARRAFPQTFVTVLWGMTEGGLTTCLPTSSDAQLEETAGVGLPDLELVVLDADGVAHTGPADGELAMRGPGVLVGYAGDDDLYRSLLTDDGYFRTGDLAHLDAAGYLRITGRLKDLMIRGGVNISPVPTEDTLAAHPGVRAVAVVGAPDARLGERICAVVVPGEQRPSGAELVAFCTERGLPRRQLPELILYVDDLPRTPAGKVRKTDLRDLVARVGAAEIGDGS
jgi:acyl-CoA synthetase (AMP-forming)/AMP-acid ligase II